MHNDILIGLTESLFRHRRSLDRLAPAYPIHPDLSHLRPDRWPLLAPDRHRPSAGELLFPIVSLSIAIILFEGGLTLRFADLHRVRGVLRSILSLGVMVTWALTTLLAMLLLGFNVQIAVLLGALLVVTGPTVIIPLLRQVRPSGRVGSLLRWEGIVIDPIGVALTVLVFEAIVSTTPNDGIVILISGLLRTSLVGFIIGYLAARLLLELLRRHWLPDTLENPVTLVLVLAAFAVSNLFQSESGLLTVTVMGVVLANQDLRILRRWRLSGGGRIVSIDHILEFKETLQTLLVSSLFIILAARLRLADLTGLGWGTIAFVAALILIVRPAAIWLCTIGSPLTWQERVFIGWMAPRGIVAAATASIFGLTLVELGVPGAERLTPVVFTVIIGTVIIYGITAAPLAQRLGLSQANPQGTLIVGAHGWARAIAETLSKLGFKVLLVDTNYANTQAARMDGLNVVYGNISPTRRTNCSICPGSAGCWR
ncbi:MAG: sodium:proton antiporter [Chloroflexi bacterium]|nr:sodium:proton antiporter [Chloroflexota bacterium]